MNNADIYYIEAKIRKIFVDEYPNSVMGDIYAVGSKLMVDVVFSQFGEKASEQFSKELNEFSHKQLDKLNGDKK